VRREEGQATIEFALTLILTLTIIFGLLDFSRAMYTASVIQWAAQEGARAGILELPAEEIITTVHEQMIGLNNCPVPVECISVSYPPGDNPMVTIVQVDVRYEFQFITPIVARITGESIEMHASASMIAY
jgi:hypothetical protein